MLFEKTAYENDFPINLRIMKVKEYPIHYHQDIEFIYVLKGEIQLKDVCSNYLLREGDLFTINGHEVHGLTATDKENIIAVIQVSNLFFTQHFPDLAKACFMTGGKNDTYHKLGALRRMLLHILLDYSRKSFNYKNSCIYQMLNVIKYLNEHFNLFAFEGQQVLNFKNNNPIIVERISRIINYVYENHANKISLEDLAEREHLSSYYLSHLIRDNMGINFQEFLCFARVEMSEIPLLETDQKISTIAADSGFSKTSYYEKFFEKWFGHAPKRHRQLFSSRVLSDDNPALIEVLSENQAVNILKHCLSVENGQEKNPSTVRHLHFSVALSPNATAFMHTQHTLEVSITPEDYHIMGERLFSFLYDLNVSDILLTARSNDSEASLMLLSNRLRFLGYNVSVVYENSLEFPVSFGYDSIARAIHLFQSALTIGSEKLSFQLRDQGDFSKVLKGMPASLTSCMIPKPSFYAYKLISHIKGDLIACGKYYYVIRSCMNHRISYIFVLINFNDEISQICLRPTSMHETNDIISTFMDELSVDFSIQLSTGKYMIAKYALTNDTSIFAQMSYLNFLDNFPFQEEWIHLLNTEPLSQVTVKNAEETLDINASLRGAGVQIIVASEIIE